jgi:WD40 repeat protein
MTAVFISHSNLDDQAEASALRAALTEAGYENVFLDSTSLLAMRDWETQLHRQLAVADVVVFLYSTASAKSSWCHREIGIARYRNRPVLVVPLESLERYPDLGTLQQLPFKSDRRLRHTEVLAVLQRSGYGPETSFKWDVDESPYPGLAPFEADRAAVFFGRDQDVRDLEGYLNPARDGGAVVLLAGASGTGKSSLVRAGLLPRLRRRPHWLVPEVLEPGPHFRAQLARVLDGLPAQDPADVTDRCSPILVIDQAERLLVDRDRTPSGIPALEDLAAALSRLRSLHVLLVTKTVDTGLTTPIADWLIARHLVVGLSRTQLAQVVAEPAARAGVTVDPVLVSQLVEATPSGDALPLLALTLAEMWNRRSRTDLLTLDDYERVGGVTKILNDVTQSVLRTLPGVPEDEVAATMLTFVSVDQEAQAISVARPLESFTANQRRIVDAFAERRLVTVKDATVAASASTAALTHDALMSSWGRLATAIDDERVQLVLENDVHREASRGDREWTLLSGQRLDDALKRFEDREVDESVAGYLEACVTARAEAVAARERAMRLRIQRRRWTVLAAAGMAVALVALTAVVFLRRQNTQIAALEQAARAVSLSGTRRDAALIEALRAVDRSASPATYSALVQVLTDQPGARRYLAAGGSQVVDAAWTPGGGLLLASAAGVERVDEDTTERRIVTSSAGQAGAVAASRDGSVIAAVNSERLALVAGGQTSFVPAVSHGLLPMLAMDRRGDRIAVADLTPQIRVLNGRGRPIATWRTDRFPADLAMSDDGRTVASVDRTGAVSVFEVGSDEPKLFETPQTQLVGVTVSADGRTVVTVSSTGKVERVLPARPVENSELPTPGPAIAAAFLADGVLAIGHQNGSLALLDPVTGNQLATFGSHRAPVKSIAGTSSRLVSVADDGEVVIWNGPGAVPLLGAVMGPKASKADVGDDGRVVTVGADDRTVTEWPLSGRPRSSRPLAEDPTAVAAGASGQLAVATAHGSVLILNQDLVAGPPLAASTEEIACLEWVGDRLAVGTKAGEIVLLRGGQVESRVRVAKGVAVNALRGLPDGDIAWGTGAGLVGIWSGTNNGTLRTLGAGQDDREVNSLEYADAGQTLYSAGDDRQAVAWRLADTDPDRRTKVASHKDAIVGLALLSDAAQDWLATASQDRSIQLWDLRAGTPIGPAIAAPGGARFTWAAGGAQRLVTLDTPGRVIAWNLSPSGLVRTACDALLPGESGVAKPSTCDS